MTEYALIKEAGCYYVQGLPCWTGSYPNTILTLVSHDGASADRLQAQTIGQPGERMHRALYDLYQVNDTLTDGDVFTLGGKPAYLCSGVHVVPAPDTDGGPI